MTLQSKDVKKIKEEIEYRKLTVRKNAIEAVKEARAHGDLSENFEYHAAKKDKNMNESRIRYLERMLKNAEIVSDQSKPDEVGINNTVTLYMEDDDEEEEAFDNPTRLDRLKPYLQTPRDMETPFFRAVAGNAPWLFKDRWKKKYTESPVIYAAMLNAKSSMRRQGEKEN